MSRAQHRNLPCARASAARRRRRLLVSLFLAAWVGMACRSAPPTHYYVLAPAAAPGPTSAPALDSEGLQIGVEPFTVDPPYDHDRLIYRLGADAVEVGFYEYHRWAAPLGELVAVAMAEGLQGTAGVAVIEPVTVGGDYSALLRGRVIYLEEIDLPGRQQARLHLELRLVDPAGLPLWSQDISAAAEGNAQTVGDVVELLYRAFRQALEEAGAGLAAAISPRSE